MSDIFHSSMINFHDINALTGNSFIESRTWNKKIKYIHNLRHWQRRIVITNYCLGGEGGTCWDVYIIYDIWGGICTPVQMAHLTNWGQTNKHTNNIPYWSGFQSYKNNIKRRYLSEGKFRNVWSVVSYLFNLCPNIKLITCLGMSGSKCVL